MSRTGSRAMKHPDYGKWIEDALRRNPNLSKAGLSRHLGHGADRARVIKIVEGRRKITAQEVREISVYLGVPPPGETEFAARVPVVGAIDPAMWLEKGVSRVSDTTIIPSRTDPRYPPETQVAYQMAVDRPSVGLLAGDFVLAVPKTTLAGAAIGMQFVAYRERSTLRQFELATVEANRSGLVLRSAATPRVDGDLTPVALVIGVFRPIG